MDLDKLIEAGAISLGIIAIVFFGLSAIFLGRWASEEGAPWWRLVLAIIWIFLILTLGNYLWLTLE